MPCPRCGATTERAFLLSPGLYRCQNEVDDDEFCYTTYQDGPTAVLGTAGLCGCGMAGVGICQGPCGRPLCSEHAIGGNDAAKTGPPREVFDDLACAVPWKRAYLAASDGIACEACRIAATETATSLTWPPPDPRWPFLVAVAYRHACRRPPLVAIEDIETEIRLCVQLGAYHKETFQYGSGWRDRPKTATDWKVGSSLHTHGPHGDHSYSPAVFLTESGRWIEAFCGSHYSGSGVYRRAEAILDPRSVVPHLAAVRFPDLVEWTRQAIDFSGSGSWRGQTDPGPIPASPNWPS